MTVSKAIVTHHCSVNSQVEVAHLLWTQVTVGRLDENTLSLPDTEVSGRHVVIRWEPTQRCWQVTDTGSLNGTFLNGKTISTNNRKQGREHCLSSDDMVQLGSYSKVRYSAAAIMVQRLPSSHFSCLLFLSSASTTESALSFQVEPLM